jgi:hypothetical protein
MKSISSPHSIVSVVACGPSALDCGAARAPGFVIAVNDAFMHVRHDAVLTMDGRWIRYRVPKHFMSANGPPLYVRTSAWRHLPANCDGGDAAHYGRIKLFDCNHATPTFGSTENQLNGPNSGYCALNLAYVLRPQLVYLFGFDHQGKHFHKESEWRLRGEGCANSASKFRVWAEACDVARTLFDARGIRVINTNRNSLIKSFKFGDMAV